MRDVFKSFFVLRLIGLLALLGVAGLVVGIRSLIRGSDVEGLIVLGGVAVLAAAIAGLVAQRPR